MGSGRSIKYFTGDAWMVSGYHGNLMTLVLSKGRDEEVENYYLSRNLLSIWNILLNSQDITNPEDHMEIGLKGRGKRDQDGKDLEIIYVELKNWQRFQYIVPYLTEHHRYSLWLSGQPNMHARSSQSTFWIWTHSLSREEKCARCLRRDPQIQKAFSPPRCVEVEVVAGSNPNKCSILRGSAFPPSLHSRN